LSFWLSGHMTKIAILGAGSIGCWIGGHLAAGSADVVLIGRQYYADQIAENGLTLTHFKRDKIHLPHVDFVTQDDVLSEVDIIALCTKSQDTEMAAQQIIAKAKSDVTVISFQNGIRNAEILRACLPKTMTIVPAIVPFNVTPSGVGQFHSGTEGKLILGRVVQPVVQALTASGQGVDASENIEGDQWAKMIVNLNNGLNSLTGTTLRKGLYQKDYRLALAACVTEALEIAAARHIEVGQFNGRHPAALVKTLHLPNWAYRLVMQFIVKIDDQARSSMLDDLEAGRPSEIEYLQGEIMRQAELANLEAPKNRAIRLSVDAAFKAGKTPHLTGSEILNLIG